MSTEPTQAAKRAVENLGLVSECAEVIDEQTGLPELIAACETCQDDITNWMQCKRMARIALKIAREGRT